LVHGHDEVSHAMLVDEADTRERVVGEGHMRRLGGGGPAGLFRHFWESQIGLVERA